MLPNYRPHARVRYKSSPVFSAVVPRARISFPQNRNFATLYWGVSTGEHYRAPVFCLLLTGRRKKISRARPRGGAASAGCSGRLDRARSISSLGPISSLGKGPRLINEIGGGM